MKPRSRRVVGVRVSPELLALWITQGQETHVRCVVGLPPDARGLYAFNNPEWGCVMLVFEHESFPEVEEGAMLPTISPQMETLCA